MHMVSQWQLFDLKKSLGSAHSVDQTTNTKFPYVLAEEQITKPKCSPNWSFVQYQVQNQGNYHITRFFLKWRWWTEPLELDHF